MRNEYSYPDEDDRIVVGAVIGAVNEMRDVWRRAIAPPGQEGWREAPGWLFRRSLLNNHPVCASLEAARHFPDRAATPPVQEGQLPASRDRAIYSHVH